MLFTPLFKAITVVLSFNDLLYVIITSISEGAITILSVHTFSAGGNSVNPSDVKECVCFKAADWRDVPQSFSLTAAINSLYHPPPLISVPPSF